VESPRIDVILPYRDAAATIEEALDSVLSQRGVDVSVIAIDDGSKDVSQALVSRFAARHRGVVSLSTPGVGVAGALAFGLSRAETPFVARMDADDVSLPGRFQQQVAGLESNAKIAVIATTVELFPAGLGEGLERYVAWQNGLLTPADHAREIFIESPICHPSVVMRRASLLAVGGYRDTPGPEDYDLWLRIDGAGLGIAKVAASLLKWRRHAGQATFNEGRYARPRFIEAKAHYLALRLSAVSRGRRMAVWGAGPTGRQLARALTQHGVRTDFFVDIDPRKIGRRAHGAEVVAPDHLDRKTDFVVAAVGTRGARDLIRQDLVSRQFVETIDFLCAA
jgi:glycosyltransferase involved in cell wall biosynthesis